MKGIERGRKEMKKGSREVKREGGYEEGRVRVRLKRMEGERGIGMRGGW